MRDAKDILRRVELLDAQIDYKLQEIDRLWAMVTGWLPCCGQVPRMRTRRRRYLPQCFLIRPTTATGIFGNIDIIAKDKIST